MRTPNQYLIEKRDGRLQTLRASKLARSLLAALGAVREAEGCAPLVAGVMHSAEALRLTQQVMRRARGAVAVGRICAADLALLCCAVLRESGYAEAALAYAARGRGDAARAALRAARGLGIAPAVAVAGYPAARPFESPRPAAARDGDPRWPECN